MKNAIFNNNGGISLHGGTYIVARNCILGNTNDNSIIFIDLQYGQSIEVSIHNNTIMDNKAPKAIYHRNEHPGSPSILSVNFNNIYNNVSYELYNDHDIDMDASKNWWGTTTALEVDLKIFDISGRLVKTILDNNTLAAQYHHFIWDATSNSGRAVSSGAYFIQLIAGDTQRIVKVLYLK